MLKLLFLTVACLGSCVAYDDRLAVPTLPNDGGDGAHATGGIACTDPNEAQLSVEEYAFIVRCGCAEAPGIYTEDSKQCTVKAGTKVTWVFEGSLQHNVSSTTFDESRPRTAGRHSVTFDSPGVYPYGCALHAGQMSGYTIIVE